MRCGCLVLRCSRWRVEEVQLPSRRQCTTGFFCFCGKRYGVDRCLILRSGVGYRGCSTPLQNHGPAFCSHLRKQCLAIFFPVGSVGLNVIEPLHPRDATIQSTQIPSHLCSINILALNFYSHLRGPYSSYLIPYPYLRDMPCSLKQVTGRLVASVQN